MRNPEIILWDGGRLNREFFIRCQKANTLVIVQFNIIKKEVKNLDLTRTRMMLDSIAEIGEPARQSLLVCFSYDDDPRELTQIPEVTKYIARVVQEYSFLFYYLLSDLNQHMITSLIPHVMLTAPLAPPGQKLVQLDMNAAERQFAELSEAVTAYGKRIGDERGARSAIRAWRQTLNL